MTSEKSKFDRLLWLFVLAIIIGAVAGYYYFSAQSLLLRVLGFLLAIAAAFVVAYQTSFGKYVWAQWLEAIQEIRRMVWPTRKETVQTTVAVLVMIVVMGILLWSADFILLRTVAWLMGLGA